MTGPAGHQQEEGNGVDRVGADGGGEAVQYWAQDDVEDHGHHSQAGVQPDWRG